MFGLDKICPTNFRKNSEKIRNRSSWKGSDGHLGHSFGATLIFLLKVDVLYGGAASLLFITNNHPVINKEGIFSARETALVEILWEKVLIMEFITTQT